MPELSQKSVEQLKTCVPELQQLFFEVVKDNDCIIIEGHRGEQKQHTAFITGNSKEDWPHGKHNSLPSKAVDVMPLPLNWGDAQGILAFADAVKKVAQELQIKVVYGGDWKKFPDRDHWEVL